MAISLTTSRSRCLALANSTQSHVHRICSGHACLCSMLMGYEIHPLSSAMKSHRHTHRVHPSTTHTCTSDDDRAAHQRPREGSASSRSESPSWLRTPRRFSLRERCLATLIAAIVVSSDLLVIYCVVRSIVFVTYHQHCRLRLPRGRLRDRYRRPPHHDVIVMPSSLSLSFSSSTPSSSSFA